MTNNELEILIRKWEDSKTEFKRELGNTDELPPIITAFANTEGGKLIFGVDEKSREVCGLADADKLMNQIDQASRQNVDPPILLTQEKVEYSGKIVLVVTIPKGPDRPYQTNKGVYYLKAASERRKATRDELMRIYQSAGQIFSDEFPVPGTNEGDINEEFFKDYLKTHRITYPVQREDNIRLLKNLKIINDDGVLTTYGLLCFGKEPQSKIPFAKIIMVKYRGEDRDPDPVDRKIPEGKISDQKSGAELFFETHIPAPIKTSGFEPEGRGVIPFEILKEAITNALVHRDYSIPSEIRIFLFSNRIEIRNPGRLLNTITVENIKLGAGHVLRNPGIYNFAAKMGYVTGIGDGVRRIFELAEKANLTEPLIKMEGTDFVLTLFYPK